MRPPNYKLLRQQALYARKLIIEMIYKAGSGHPGGSLSCVDLLTYLYFHELELDIDKSDWADRDRFILSKGHACAALYAVLGLRGCLGHNPDVILETFRRIGGILQGHPSVKHLAWVETNSGSLGQGFSSAVGMAIGLRYQKIPAKVYAMIGDGETQEGSVWEAAMFSAHNKLDNLCVIIDYNKMQSDALNSEIVSIEPLKKKWQAFNWNVVEVDGHDFKRIHQAFTKIRLCKDKPSCIIAHTIKGKGVSYMEGAPLWHGSVKLSDDNYLMAISDLEKLM